MKTILSRRLLRRVVAYSTLLVVIVSLASCHPLINPVDPKSSAYVGTRTEPDAEPEARLPEVTKWEIFAEHGAGPSPARIPLTIPEDELFTEPRDVSAATGFYEIEMTFAEPITDQDTEGGLFLVGIVNDTDAAVREFGSPDLELVDGGQRLRFILDLLPPTTPAITAPYQFRVTMRLIDPNQVVLDERTVYFLSGDVNGDGEVDALDTNGATKSVNVVLGQLPDPRRPTSVRADVDVSGVVDAVDVGDVTNASGNTVANILNLIM